MIYRFLLEDFNCGNDASTMTRGKAISAYVARLQSTKDGAFAGDQWGETDLRFVYQALAVLSLIDASILHVNVIRCDHMATQNRYSASPNS